MFHVRTIFIAVAAITCSMALIDAGPCWLASYAEARQRFDQSTVEPSDANLKQGLELMRQGNYEAAIDSFQQAVYFSRNHYNPKAYTYLGLCYKATRNYAKAIEAFKYVLSQSTEKEPDVHIDLAESYLDLGDTEKARQQIDQAYIDQTESSGTWRQKYAMGEMHAKMNDQGQALSFFESALEEKPHYTEAAMGIGKMDVLLKRYNEALKQYRDILEHGPLFKNVDLHELYYNMGSCFYARGDHQGALDHWRLALESNPDSYDAHLALGKMFDDEKHYSSAIHEYEAALRCAPKGGGSSNQISQRLQYIETRLAPKEAAPVIKPSPQMRQQYEDAINQRNTVNNAAPPTKDSGF